jgi:hypothetical protein
MSSFPRVSVGMQYWTHQRPVLMLMRRWSIAYCIPTETVGTIKRFIPSPGILHARTIP